MNKEEQIKRLAQNLYNKGFTKSMDFAIQTAAKMLGFPESMLQNKLAEAEANKFSGSSILNGGTYYGQGQTASSTPTQTRPREQEYKTQHEEIANASPLDMRKRIAQSIAEESVYEKVPGARRLVESTHSFSAQQNQQTVQSQSMDFGSIDKPELSIDYTSSEQVTDEIAKPEVSSQENIFDNKFDNGFDGADSFIQNREDEMVISEPETEFQNNEQTSLISGFRNQVTPEQKSSEQPSLIQQQSQVQQQSSYSISQSLEPASSLIEESDEDFFTEALLQKQVREETPQQKSFSSNEHERVPELVVQQTTPRSQTQISSNQGQASQKQAMSNEPDVSIDLNQMFNFNNPNMKK